MMDRRAFLACACGVPLAAAVTQASAAAPGALQAAAVPVDVVKLMAFTCSFCYQAEGGDRLISAAVERTGGRFIRAPIPIEEQPTGWRERVYYAARDLDPRFGEVVKQSLYRGLQESDITLNDLQQMYYWFMEDIPNEQNRFEKMFERAQADAARDALARAERLVRSSGATQVPTYVLLVRGVIQATMDTSSSRGNSLASLRDDVIAKVEQLSKPKS